MKKPVFIQFITLIAASLMLTTSMPLKSAQKETLVIGKLVSSVVEDNKAVDAKAEAIVEGLSEYGVSEYEIKEVKGISQMLEMLTAGKIDWVTDTLFPALIYAEYANADIFEQNLKSGLPKFYSVFFVKKESDIESVADLDRKMLAFGNAFSTESYFIPYYELTEQRYTLLNYGAKVDEEIIGAKRRIYFRYSYNEDEVVRQVLMGKVDAGVISNHDYMKLPAEKKAQLKIVHNSAAFIKNIEVVRGGIDPPLKRKLKQLIYEYNAETERTVIPVDNDKTTRFYKFIGEGRDGFVYLRSLVEHGTVPVLIEKKQKKKKKDYFY